MAQHQTLICYSAARCKFYCKFHHHYSPAGYISIGLDMHHHAVARAIKYYADDFEQKFVTLRDFELERLK